MVVLMLAATMSCRNAASALTIASAFRPTGPCSSGFAADHPDDEYTHQQIPWIGLHSSSNADRGQ